jgi:hypothetical protein
MRKEPLVHRLRTRGLALMLGASSAILLGSLPAQAATAPLVGWWTSASATTPTTVVAPVGADVPKGGLLVQSAADANAPVAFGALTFELPEGATVTRLVLKVPASTATIANSVLALCALQRPDFTPADGGALSSAPGYDCSHKIVASPSPDGTTYTFNAEPLRTDTTLAVAVVPASAPGRVVIAPPAADSLLLTLSTTGPSASVPGDPTPAAESGSPATAPIQTPTNLAAVPPFVTAAQPPVMVAPIVPSSAAPASDPSTGLAAQTPSTRGFAHQGLLALLLVGALLATWTAASVSAAKPLPVAPHEPSEQ